jgi:uridine kinase
VTSAARVTTLEQIVEAIRSRGGGAARIAVDGPDAAGKTIIADELASMFERRGLTVVRASIDGFHRPRSERHAAGALSPRGYLDDSFDLAALSRDVLGPLGPGGSRRIVRARYDWRSDAAVAGEPELVPPGAVLLLDGVFLHRPELAHCWEASIFVFARADVILDRARERDADALGGVAEVERRYRARYMPGQALYFERDRPHERADVAVENSDPGVPRLDREAVARGVAAWIEEWRP